MKLKIGLAQNILYQFNIFCTGTKTNCTKVQIELQHVYRLCIEAMSVKGSEASHILPICCLSSPVSLFSSFLSLGKRYQITEVRSHVH